MAALTTQFVVYYHGGFSGRAQPADLMLEDAGVPWRRGSKQECFDQTGCVFAMPAVGKGARIVGQTTAACAFLGSEIGYAPAAGFEFDALKIACDVADIWSEGYAKRKSRDPELALRWLTERFVRFVQVIEATRNAAAQRAGVADPWPYLLGAAPCYADFLWLNAVLVLEFMYGPKRTAKVLAAAGAPGVVGATAAMRARPKIAAFVASAEPVLYASVAFAGLFGSDEQ